MRRRCLHLTLLALFTLQPAHGQQWLNRYLNERKQREQEEARKVEEAREALERERRRREASRPAAQPETPPPTRLSDTMPPPPAPQEEVEAAIPKAIPLEPFERPQEEAPAAAPVSSTPSAPAAAEPENFEGLEVRRAEPVTPPSSTEEAPKSEEPQVATPAATEPAKEEVIPEELNPGANEIRLTPNAAASLPADVAQFLLANRLYLKKEYQAAIPEFEQYLRMAPNGADRPAALFRLAECYRITGSYNAARRNYEALIYTVQLGAFIGPAAYRLAEICYNEKDYAGAVAFFRKASVWIQEPSIALAAKFYSARSLENLKFTGDAIRAYEDVLASWNGDPLANPYREAAHLALISLFSDMGRRTQALALLQKVREESAKPALKAEAAVRIGLIYADQKQNERAEQELRDALKMPELGEWREIAETALLRLLYNTGRYKEAVQVYNESSKQFSPELAPEVLLIIGNSLRQLGKNEAAREMYDQVVQNAPSSAYAKDAGYERLVALYNTNDPNLIAEIDQYLATNPEASERRDQLTLMKAEAYYKVRNYAAAAPLYAQLKNARLSSALRGEALFKLGWCYTQVGAYDNAVEAFTEFLEAHPAHRMAAMALAQRAFCHEQKHDYTKALADFDEVIRRFPKAKEREFSLQRKALILGQQDESKAMVETFKQLLREFPKSPAAGQANYWIGITAFNAKDYRGALEPLKAARALDKEFAERATSRILACEFSLENRDSLAQEVDNAGPKIKVPSEILRWLGNEFIKTGDATHAERYLAKLTEREGEEAGEVLPDDWLKLGEARINLQKWDEARDAIQHYLRKVENPLPKARGTLALGRAELGARHFEAAQEAANMTQALQPEGKLNALGRVLSGDIAAAQGRNEEAAKLYMSVAVIFDDPVITPQSLEKAYLAYQRMGDEKQAAKTLNTLKSRFPEYKLTVSEAKTSAR